MILRRLRTERHMGLRELARNASISPAFLSKVEAGTSTPPAEQKIRALARALDYDGDCLMVLSGRLPADVMGIISRYPPECMALLRSLRHCDKAEIAGVAKAIKGGRLGAAARGQARKPRILYQGK